MNTEKNWVTSFLSPNHGAGEGNRTLVFSLGITIHPFYVDIQKVLQ